MARASEGAHSGVSNPRKRIGNLLLPWTWHRGSSTSLQQTIEETQTALMMLTLIGLGSLGVYAFQFAEGQRWAVLGTGLAVAGAAALGGGLLGFLFGVPSTAKAPQNTEDQSLVTPNTNLEQVSDWLTKLLIGVGLVQLGRAPRALGRLAQNLAPAFGRDDATGRAFALGTVIFFAILGFLYGWVWARLSLEVAMGQRRRRHAATTQAKVSTATTPPADEEDGNILPSLTHAGAAEQGAKNVNGHAR